MLIDWLATLTERCLDCFPGFAITHRKLRVPQLVKPNNLSFSTTVTSPQYNIDRTAEKYIGLCGEKRP